MIDQDDLFAVKAVEFVADTSADPTLFKITFREASTGEEAMLGANVIGRINLHPHEKTKRASWISFIPSRAGIRMISPISVTDQAEARRALTECMRAWLHNCALSVA